MFYMGHLKRLSSGLVYDYRILGSIQVCFEILAKLLKLTSGGSNDVYDGKLLLCRHGYIRRIFSLRGKVTGI